MISLILDIGHLSFKGNNKDYWNLETVNLLVTCMEELPFWNAFKYTKDKSKEYIGYNLIENRNDLQQYLPEQKSKYIETKQLSFDNNNTCSYLNMEIGGSQMHLSLSLKKRDYQSFALEKKAVSYLKNFALKIIDNFSDATSIGKRFNLRAYGSTFYKVRPPYNSAQCRWQQNSIIDIIDERDLAKDKEEEMTVISAITNLPTFVIYEKKEYFHILTWIEDLSDEQAISQALTERNQWLHQYIPLSRNSSYNAFGDVKNMEVYLGMSSNIHLTYYETDVYNIPYGFQSMVILPNGSTDEVLLNNLSTWIEDEKLPDGTPIKKIGLIVQDREAALLIFDRAKKMGLYKVLYMDDEGHFWDINPSGLWLN